MCTSGCPQRLSPLIPLLRGAYPNNVCAALLALLGFVAFHIKSRPRRPQKIKEKWQDAQSFPRGTLADPNVPERWVGVEW